MLLWCCPAWAMPVAPDVPEDLGIDWQARHRDANVVAALVAGDYGRVRGLLDGRIEPDPQVEPPPFETAYGLPVDPIGVATTLALREGRTELLAWVAPSGSASMARHLLRQPDLPPSARPVVAWLAGAHRLTGEIVVVPGRIEASEPPWTEHLLARYGDGGTACQALIDEDLWLLARLRDELPDRCRLPDGSSERSELLATRSVARLVTLGGSAATPCALRHAAWTSELPSIEWLLEAGVGADTECDGAPPLLSAGSAEAVQLLLRAGAEPFPADFVPDLHQDPAVFAQLLDAETAHPERRERVIAHAWLTGRHTDLVRPLLPEGWAGQPSGTLPGLAMSTFRLALDAAEGLDGLAEARGGVPFGSPIDAPCVLPIRRAEAVPLLGEIWISDRRRTREIRGEHGVVAEERAGGRWRMVRLEIDPEACPELDALWPMLPVLTGPTVRLTDGRTVERQHLPRDRTRWVIHNTLAVDRPTRRAMIEASRGLQVTYPPPPSPPPPPPSPPPHVHPPLPVVSCELDPPPPRDYPYRFPADAGPRLGGWADLTRSPFAPTHGYRLEPHDVDLAGLIDALVADLAPSLGYAEPPSLEHCPAGTTEVTLGEATLTAQREAQGIGIRFTAPLLPTRGDLAPKGEFPEPEGVRGRLQVTPRLHACDPVPGDDESCADAQTRQREAWAAVAHRYPPEGTPVEVIALDWSIEVATVQLDGGWEVRLAAFPRPAVLRPPLPLHGDDTLDAHLVVEERGNLDTVVDAVTGETLPWTCEATWLDVRHHIRGCERLP